MALEFFSASGNASANSIFIPVSNLTGLLSAEIESGDPLAFKNASFVYSFLKKLRSTVSATSYLTTQAAGNYLGLFDGGTDTIPTTGLINSTITMTTQFVVDKVMGTCEVLPLNNNDDGMLSFTDVFPNAVKVASAGSTGGAGVCIPSADIEAYGSPAYAGLDLDADSRSLITAILTYLYHDIAILRATNVTSAFTAKSKANAIVAIPATATDPTSPTTGIDANDLDWLAGLSETLSFTIQLAINDDETISPNVA